MRGAIRIMDWIGRLLDMLQIVQWLFPFAGFAMGIGFGGALWGLLGLALGLAGLFVVVLISKAIDVAVERLWPYAEIAVEPNPHQGEWGYGRSVDGYLSTAFVMVNITANNPGRWPERITNMRCDLTWKRYRFLRRVVWSLPIEKWASWELLAKGEPESKSYTFHKTDPAHGVRVPMGEDIAPTVVVEFGSKRRTIKVDLPDIRVRGPYSG